MRAPAGSRSLPANLSRASSPAALTSPSLRCQISLVTFHPMSAGSMWYREERRIGPTARTSSAVPTHQEPAFCSTMSISAASPSR